MSSCSTCLWKNQSDAWEDADKATLDFLRVVIGHNDLPEELVELPWDIGGLDTILSNTQKKAVDMWKARNMVVVNGVMQLQTDK